MSPHVAAALAQVRRAREAGIEPAPDVWVLFEDGETSSSENDEAA